MQCQFNDSVFLIPRKSLALETIHVAHLASQSVTPLSSKLPQMMIHVEVGVAHALGPRHLTKHRVRRELALRCTEALRKNAELLQIGCKLRWQRTTLLLVHFRPCLDAMWPRERDP